MRDPEGMLLMKTYGMLFIVMLMLILACSPVHSQDREASQEVSFFTGWTFDVALFYLWIPALDGTTTVHGISSDPTTGA
jgi:hypothetical protein